jgi:hypothetical protein
MPLTLKQIDYSDLNARQKENYNFQKVSAILADFGFVTHRLSDDWQGADFIAQHISGEIFLKVQLKGRLTFDKKYCGKDIYIAFNDAGVWYLYLHDELLNIILACTTIGITDSWVEKGNYSFPYLSPKLQYILRPFKIYPE